MQGIRGSHSGMRLSPFPAPRGFAVRKERGEGEGAGGAEA